MTLGRVALGRLHRLACGVTNDVAARRAAQHAGRGSFPRILAVREAQLTAAACAAPAWLRPGSGLAVHHHKRTMPPAARWVIT